jgi:LPS export ABC transporter protein LptC
LKNRAKIDQVFKQKYSKRARFLRQSRFGSYSSFVRFAKLTLPCIATAILALLLIIPNMEREDDFFGFDVTQPKLGEIEKLQMEEANFFITDKKNRVYNFNSNSATETEKGSKIIKLENPRGIIPSSDKSWINVDSKVGYFHQLENKIELKEYVQIFYSDGATLDTEEAIYNFDTELGYGNKNVKAEASLGTIDSKGFKIDANKAILTFTGKSKMVIYENGLK